MSAPARVARSVGRARPSVCGALALAACLLTWNASARGETRDPSSRDANYADVWLRLDAERAAAHASVGGTKSWSGFDLGANLVLTQWYPKAWDILQNDAVNQALANQTRQPALRAEAGPALLFGSLFIQPKLGLGYDLELETVGPFVPQATLILELAPLYLELGAQFFFYSPFESELQDSVQTRAALLVTWNSWLGLGAQNELTFGLKNFDGPGLRSTPLGTVATLQVAEPFTLGLFVAGDLAPDAHYHFPVGRFTATLLF